MRELYELSGYVQGAAAEVMSEAKRFGATRFVGTSGTIRTLGEAAHLLAGGAPFRSLNAQSVKRRDLRELVKRLCEARRGQARQNAGRRRGARRHHSPGRRAAVELLEMAKAEELTLCDTSLREGVIWDYIERRGVDPVPHRVIPDPRRRSVVELMRKFDRDDPRELHIAELALSLFDQTQRAARTRAALERELLEYASLLARHRSSHRLRRSRTALALHHPQLQPARLHGRRDRAARLDRAVSPRLAAAKKESKLDDLAVGRSARVIVLSAILRLAVALDRGHSQLVRRLHVEERKKELRIVIDGPGDLLLRAVGGAWQARAPGQGSGARDHAGAHGAGAVGGSGAPQRRRLRAARECRGRPSFDLARDRASRVSPASSCGQGALRGACARACGLL